MERAIDLGRDSASEGASIALPERVHLPSGRVVRLSERAARAAAATATEAGVCIRDLRVLGGPSVLSDDDGAALDPLRLPLRDAHTLRALLAYAGVVPEEIARYACDNCGEAFEVAPSRLLEVGPFVDGELRDPELDRPFDFDAWHRVPALRVGRAVCRRVRLSPRTAQEALPLLRIGEAPALRVTPAIVTAMGVTALGAERRATAIADALAAAPEAAWGAIADLYDEAHYPARLVAVRRCEACGARNELDVPRARELCAPDGERKAAPRLAPSQRTKATFLDLDAFEAKVRAAAERIYAARGVRNIGLFIDAGVPACDDGGEPLLGCYMPGPEVDGGGIPEAPEIRIFYRTFQAEARHDPGFDVDAEIDETIDHEVTHHLHHLSGEDPLDDEEQAVIADEQARLVGRAESARRARRDLIAEIRGFLRATWPVWVLVAVASALGWWCR